MARDARGVDAEEHAAHVDRERVHVIEPVRDAVVVHAFDEAALQLVAAADDGERGDRGMHLGRRREHVMHQPVVGPIDGELLLEPVVEGVGARSGLVRHAQQVAPVPGPLLGELVAREQQVDQAVALVGGRVGNERPHLGRRGRQADDIEVEAPHELVVARQAGVRHAVLGDARKDNLVDDVAAWHGTEGHCGIGGRHHGAGEAGGVASPVDGVPRHVFVSGFHAVVWRRRWRGRAGLGPDRDRVEAGNGGDKRRRAARPRDDGHRGPPD